ncbi:MAG: hypothetical protein MHPSP_003073 [Paramarteilia canceri]
MSDISLPMPQSLSSSITGFENLFSTGNQNTQAKVSFWANCLEYSANRKCQRELDRILVLKVCIISLCIVLAGPNETKPIAKFGLLSLISNEVLRIVSCAVDYCLEVDENFNNLR